MKRIIDYLKEAYENEEPFDFDDDGEPESFDDIGCNDLLEGIEDYKAFHWGEQARSVIEIDRPRVQGPLVMVGPLTSVSYLAKKNEKEVCEYVHDFDEPLPVLAFDRTGKLHILGGGYSIQPRGIVG